MAEWVAQYGAAGLFAAAFLGATLLPLSSEVALVAALAAGMPVVEALVAASVGNSLACVLNWSLGRWARGWIAPRLHASRTGRAALDWAERWGPASLFLSWLPVVGDPLTVAAGLSRVPFVTFVLIVLPLRVARYVALASAF